jgi:hypothetical protein
MEGEVADVAGKELARECAARPPEVITRPDIIRRYRFGSSASAFA